MSEPLFSEDLLAELEGLNTANFDASCAIEQPITIRQAGGTSLNTWQALMVEPCRIAPAGRVDQERFAAGQETRVALWELVFRPGIQVKTTWRGTVTIPAQRGIPASQKIVYFLGADAPRSNETETGVIAEERGAQ